MFCSDTDGLVHMGFIVVWSSAWSVAVVQMTNVSCRVFMCRWLCKEDDKSYLACAYVGAVHYTVRLVVEWMLQDSYI